MNPLFEQYGKQNQNGFANSFAQFVNNFRQTSNRSPEEVVKELLASGRMPQQQFEQLRNTANQLTGKNY